jgi:hypothetical protein
VCCALELTPPTATREPERRNRRSWGRGGMSTRPPGTHRRTHNFSLSTGLRDSTVSRLSVSLVRGSSLGTTAHPRSLGKRLATDAIYSSPSPVSIVGRSPEGVVESAVRRLGNLLLFQLDSGTVAGATGSGLCSPCPAGRAAVGDGDGRRCGGGGGAGLVVGIRRHDGEALGSLLWLATALTHVLGTPGGSVRCGRA